MLAVILYIVQEIAEYIVSITIIIPSRNTLPVSTNFKKIVMLLESNLRIGKAYSYL